MSLMPLHHSGWLYTSLHDCPPSAEWKTSQRVASQVPCPPCTRSRPGPCNDLSDSSLTCQVAPWSTELMSGPSVPTQSTSSPPRVLRAMSLHRTPSAIGSGSKPLPE